MPLIYMKKSASKFSQTVYWLTAGLPRNGAGIKYTDLTVVREDNYSPDLLTAYAVEAKGAQVLLARIKLYADGGADKDFSDFLSWLPRKRDTWSFTIGTRGAKGVELNFQPASTSPCLNAVKEILEHAREQGRTSGKGKVGILDMDDICDPEERSVAPHDAVSLALSAFLPGGFYNPARLKSGICAAPVKGLWEVHGSIAAATDGVAANLVEFYKSFEEVGEYLRIGLCALHPKRLVQIHHANLKN